MRTTLAWHRRAMICSSCCIDEMSSASIAPGPWWPELGMMTLIATSQPLYSPLYTSPVAPAPSIVSRYTVMSRAQSSSKCTSGCGASSATLPPMRCSAVLPRGSEEKLPAPPPARALPLFAAAAMPAAAMPAAAVPPAIVVPHGCGGGAPSPPTASDDAPAVPPLLGRGNRSPPPPPPGPVSIGSSALKLARGTNGSIGSDMPFGTAVAPLPRPPLPRGAAATAQHAAPSPALPPPPRSAGSASDPSSDEPRSIDPSGSEPDEPSIFPASASFR
eukprot:174437-Chlamydomonas_euryale.AAC.1